MLLKDMPIKMRSIVTIWTILSGIIAPALFWVLYFYYKDRIKPEPFLKIGLTYILGIMTAYACLWVFDLLSSLGLPYAPNFIEESQGIALLLANIGITGLVEELFKFLPFYFFCMRFRTFDEETDGIIYASTVALGFASLENMEYLAHLEGWELFGRAMASPLTHTIFSSIWGYSLAAARFKKKSMLAAGMGGISLAAVCHGLFNFLTISPSSRLASALLILVIWIWRIRILDKAGKKHREHKPG